MYRTNCHYLLLELAVEAVEAVGMAAVVSPMGVGAVGVVLVLHAVILEVVVPVFAYPGLILSEFGAPARA